MRALLGWWRSIIGGGVWLLDWAARIEWVQQKASQKWVAEVLELFPDNPLIFGAIGLGFVLWDVQSRQKQRESSAPQSIERISIIEFFREAHRRGVYLFDDSRAIRELCNRLKQDAADEVLVIWGKARHHSGTFLHIPHKTWQEYAIDWPSAFELDHSSGAIKGFPKEPEDANFYVGARNTVNSSKAYFDLSLTKSEAMAWLDRYCREFLERQV